MAFAFVQNTGSATQAASSTTMVITITNAPTAGNLLVCAATNATASDTLVSVSDTKGNTWTIASNFANPATPAVTAQVVYTLQDVGTLTALDTITVTITAVSTNIAGTVDEFTVPAGALSTDLSPVGGSTGVTAVGSTLVTAVSIGASQATTDAVELVLCVVATRGNAAQTFAQGTGWTKTSSIVKSTDQFPGVATEYAVTSSTGAQTGTWTLGIAARWVGVLVSFKVVANASVAPPAATASASSPVETVTLSGSNWIVAGITMPP